jgi:hypothetical protein
MLRRPSLSLAVLLTSRDLFLLGDSFIFLIVHLSGKPVNRFGAEAGFSLIFKCFGVAWQGAGWTPDLKVHGRIGHSYVKTLIKFADF